MPESDEVFVSVASVNAVILRANSIGPGVMDWLALCAEKMSPIICESINNHFLESFYGTNPNRAE